MEFLFYDGKTLSSSKTLGIINLFDSKLCTEKKLRSNVAKRRRKLDHLEQLFKDFLPLLQHLSETNSSSAKVFKDYLKWVQSQLQVFGEEPRAYSDYSLEKQLALFDTKLKLAFDYLNRIGTEYRNKRVTVFSRQKVRISLVPEIQTKFTYFIKKGLKAYPAFIDPHEFWLSPSELNNILFKKDYDYLSYTALTLLAKFALPETSQEYSLFYPTFFEHSTTSIVKCYNTPSVEGIVSLYLLSTIYTLECNYERALDYFTSALKMFQIVDQEKSTKHFMSVFKTSDVSKIETLRNGLSFVSTMLHTIMPEAPPFEFDSQPVSLSLNANIHQLRSDYVDTYGPSIFNLCDQENDSFGLENTLIELLTTITSHIQTVRKRYRPFDRPELVPTAELRLPLEKHFDMLKHLFDIRKKFENKSGSSNNLPFTEKSNFVSYLDDESSADTTPNEFCQSNQFAFIHSILVFILYPSVLVFPRSVLFPLDEMRILLKAANIVTEYYVKESSQHKDLQFQILSSDLSQNSSREKVDNSSSEPCLHPMQITYPTYVYLNLISLSQEPLYSYFSKSDIIKCKSSTLNILKMLKQMSQMNESFSGEAILAINKLAKYLPNYNLPQRFLSIAMEIICFDDTRSDQIISILPLTNRRI